MSNKISLHAIDQIYQSNSSDPLLMLFEITFPTGPTTYYYVNNTEDVTSNGILYTAFPFEFILPDDSLNSEPEISIRLSNVGLELISDFRVNTESITAKVSLVFASAPDISELNITNLIIKGIAYNQTVIDVMMGYEDILNIKIPSYTYSATDFPGLLSV